ncbi:hypothetical protein NQ317_003448 [Molorchus minor]|uniref:Uncharacterized protein n=1 Tax=Molorchus minor TaxID=1323400 RepID=A0ABQ9J4M8_9CUCU|nr:hypothetical protein NQ317_003448 [Molorchus minor]
MWDTEDLQHIVPYGRRPYGNVICANWLLQATLHNSQALDHLYFFFNTLIAVTFPIKLSTSATAVIRITKTRHNQRTLLVVANRHVSAPGCCSDKVSFHFTAVPTRDMINTNGKSRTIADQLFLDYTELKFKKTKVLRMTLSWNAAITCPQILQL